MFCFDVCKKPASMLCSFSTSAGVFSTDLRLMLSYLSAAMTGGHRRQFGVVSPVQP